MIKKITDQHYQGVGRLFQKYGINKPVNEKNLAAAIVVYKKGFIDDLEQETGEDFNGYDYANGRKTKDMPGHDAAKSRHIDWNKIGDGVTKGLEVAGALAKTGIGIAGEVQDLKNKKKGDEGIAGDSPAGGGGGPAEPSKMKKYLPFIIGGVVMVILMVVGAVVLMKKK
jgi:hypothetical protein